MVALLELVILASLVLVVSSEEMQLLAGWLLRHCGVMVVVHFRILKQDSK
jgi:hypothetical protein